MAYKPVKRVLASATEIRRIFNEGGYAERVRSGNLSEKPYRDGHPSPADSGEPYSTRSQIVAYLDAKGRQVALVHQYVRKDGSLGASGKPDPKKLFHQGALYVICE